METVRHGGGFDLSSPWRSLSGHFLLWDGWGADKLSQTQVSIFTQERSPCRCAVWSASWGWLPKAGCHRDGWAWVTQDVPSHLPMGVCTSFLGAVIITLSMPGGEGRPEMYAWQVFLFIISFLTMKGLFVGQDVEHTERYREENKSCPNCTTYEWLLLTIRCFRKLFPHAYHCPPSLPSSLFFPSFFFLFSVGTSWGLHRIEI